MRKLVLFHQKGAFRLDGLPVFYEWTLGKEKTACPFNKDRLLHTTCGTTLIAGKKPALSCKSANTLCALNAGKRRTLLAANSGFPSALRDPTAFSNSVSAGFHPPGSLKETLC